MHEQSPLFARLRLMIAKFLTRGATIRRSEDCPMRRRVFAFHYAVAARRAVPRLPSPSPTRNRN